MLYGVDKDALLFLNTLVPNSHFGAKLFYFPADNALLRGFPIFFPLAALWYSNARVEHRGRILIGVVTVCFSTVLSVWLQSHIHWDVRPFLDPTLHLKGMDLVERSGWDHLGSFPSDTGTLLFGLSTVVWLERRLAGALAFAWSLIIAGVIRVAVGWHYPSDVLGAAVLGCVPVILLVRQRSLVAYADGVLERLQPHIEAVHALMFFLLADALFLFGSAVQFLHGFKDVAHVLIRR